MTYRKWCPSIGWTRSGDDTVMFNTGSVKLKSQNNGVNSKYAQPAFLGVVVFGEIILLSYLNSANKNLWPHVTFDHVPFQKTPSQSREGNQECILFQFYDRHDVWHFLSAISLFFSFLVSILTLFAITAKLSECATSIYKVRLASIICPCFCNASFSTLHPDIFTTDNGLFQLSEQTMQEQFISKFTMVVFKWLITSSHSTFKLIHWLKISFCFIYNSLVIC